MIRESVLKPLSRGALLAALLAAPVAADPDLIAEVGVFSSTYQDDTPNEASYRARVGWGGVYLWGGYEEPEIRVLGQGMGRTHLLSVGLGVRHKWGPVAVFLEGGYGWTDLNNYDGQADEVAYTWLVGRHAVQGRTVPVEQCHRGCFESEYSLGDAPMGRVGLEYTVLRHVVVSASYRWMQADEYLAIWDAQRRARGGGYWEEHNNRDLGAFEMGVVFTW